MSGGGKGNGNGGPFRDTTNGNEYECTIIRRAIKSLRKDGYKLSKTKDKDAHNLMYNDKCIAVAYRQNGFIRHLNSKGINCRKLLGKEHRPDVAVIREDQKMLYIVEIKFQKVSGTADEKLQTCDFKKSQFKILADKLGLKDVEYIYVMNSSWFLKKKELYKEVFKYIKRVGCDFIFDKFPLTQMGLPDSQDEV